MSMEQSKKIKIDQEISEPLTEKEKEILKEIHEGCKFYFNLWGYIHSNADQVRINYIAHKVIKDVAQYRLEIAEATNKGDNYKLNSLGFSMPRYYTYEVLALFINERFGIDVYQIKNLLEHDPKAIGEYLNRIREKQELL